MARRRKGPATRPGEVLGIASANPPIVNREPGSAPVASNSDEARRHRRMNEGADELLPDTSGSVQHGGGATGVDMGGSGEGTDIE